MYYRSLSLLNERQPYTIVKVVEKEDGIILLFLTDDFVLYMTGVCITMIH
jgi:hypothetical protein